MPEQPKHICIISHIALWLLVLAVLPATQGVRAQEPGFIHYNVKDGLPSSVVYNCTQDEKGFMWFATESGISRFDGANFKNYSVKDGLPDNDIMEISRAGDGRIWAIPFSKNPVYFSLQTQSFITGREDTLLKQIQYSGAVQMRPSRRGGMYLFYKYIPNLYHYHNRSLTNVDRVIARDTCIGIYEPDDAHSIFFFIKRAVFQNQLTGRVKEISLNLGLPAGGWGDTALLYENLAGGGSMLTTAVLREDAAPLTVQSIRLQYPVRHVLIHEKLVYISLLAGGVLVYDRELRPQRQLLPGVQVISVFVDRQENVWFNTYTSGVLCMPAQKVITITAGGANASSFTSAVLALNDTLVLAGNAAGMLQLLTAPGGRITSLIQKTGVAPLGRVRRIRHGYAGGISFLTDQELHRSTGRSPLNFRHSEILRQRLIGSMKDFFEYRPGCYLIATHSILLRADLNVNKLDTVYRGRSTAVAAGKKGDAWFSTINGLYYLPKADRNDYELADITQNGESTRINCITQDGHGLLWVATASMGIVVLHNNRVIRRISAETGLASDICRSVYYDAINGDIWAATNNGISQIKYTFSGTGLTASAVNYNTTSGLPENDVNDVYVHNNRVYAATTAGVAIFSPALPVLSVPVHIVQVLVENREEKPAAVYSLTHIQNDISIQFTGVCFNCGGKLNYQYRMMSGVSDTAWLPAGGNTVTFSSLKPGRYTFEVRAEGGSNITRVEFYLQPPWYSQWWFWALCITALAAVVWAAYRGRIRSIARQARLSQKMSQLELQALQAQMNPHFMFNSLNAIQHFISSNDAVAARTYLGRFSKLMRLFLESSRSKYIPVQQEAELLGLYLGLEQLRFNHRFDYEVTLEASVEAGAEIPSMLIQPFAENAVNHGMLNRQAPGGCIHIVFAAVNGVITCTVEDNGAGRKKAAEAKQEGGHRHISRAVQILEERAHTLRQADGVMTRFITTDLYDADGKAAGTRVTVTVQETVLKK